MKNLLTSAAILALVSLAFTACWPGQTYDNHGLSFNYPGGWKVTVDEFAESRGYLSLEKDGEQPTASITFGWIETDATVATDMMLASIFTQMQTDGLADVALQPVQEVAYGPYPASAISYTGTVDGTPVAGAVWVFSAEGRVVNVAVREGADKGNESAFKKMRDSFEIK